MNKRFLELLREEFRKELSPKTNWGRNDVAAAFERAVNSAALMLIDETAS